jgi:amidase
MPVAEQTRDTERWRLICAKKQAQLNAAIPIQFRLPAMTCAMSGDADVREVARTSGVMTAIQLSITEINDASQLAARIASGEISSADVTTAYCARAAIAHQLVRQIKA